MPQQDTPPRRRLSRALVAREAITLADQDGLGALSMRSLATRLGVVPMALYKHVADKSDLIDRMVDVIVESYSEPKHSASWRQKVRARALSAREAILAHPWLGQAIDTRTKRSETVLAHMNAVAGDFIEGRRFPRSNPLRNAHPRQSHLGVQPGSIRRCKRTNCGRRAHTRDICVHEQSVSLRRRYRNGCGLTQSISLVRTAIRV